MKGSSVLSENEGIAVETSGKAKDVNELFDWFRPEGSSIRVASFHPVSTGLNFLLIVL